ncbi:paraneoplastic antigen Ma6E-like isoform X1 [Culex pipiens pallens]|uniref:paraneoplastic antigen Ma6E-like isoform X1 n=1 Tax=Culex pipiens pallens TaxID=42434 RepID=UPI0022AAC481|nr:paraneoplastic antigen Ma6E-like isoform X1 [Culex pipiens pallens]
MNWILAVTILASVLPLFTTAAPCCCCCCGGGDEDSSAGSVSGPVDSAGRQRSAFGWLLKAGKFLLGGGAKKGIKGSAKAIKQGGKQIGDVAAKFAAEFADTEPAKNEVEKALNAGGEGEAEEAGEGGAEGGEEGVTEGGEVAEEKAEGGEEVAEGAEGETEAEQEETTELA